MIRRRTLAGPLSAAAALILAACTAPPGDDPAMPPPTIPEDAVAYDDLKSLESRDYPYGGGCKQITKRAIADAGLQGPARAYESFTLPIPGCAIGKENGYQLRVEIVVPSDKDIPRAFPEVWTGGDTWQVAHFRRTILLQRYYAVRQVVASEFDGAHCKIVVDTGSQVALSFAGLLPKAEGMPAYGEINPEKQYRSDMDIAAAEEFGEQHCPQVQRAAETLIQEIDPNGGSLATQVASR